jgi:hypothetical protein
MTPGMPVALLFMPARPRYVLPVKPGTVLTMSMTAFKEGSVEMGTGVPGVGTWISPKEMACMWLR